MANLIVTTMLTTTKAVMDHPAGRPDVELAMIPYREQQRG